MFLMVPWKSFEIIQKLGAASENQSKAMGVIMAAIEKDEEILLSTCFAIFVGFHRNLPCRDPTRIIYELLWRAFKLISFFLFSKLLVIDTRPALMKTMGQKGRVCALTLKDPMAMRLSLRRCRRICHRESLSMVRQNIDMLFSSRACLLPFCKMISSNRFPNIII